MICAGKGARVIANIWNGSLDKRNICTMPREKQTEERGSEQERGNARERKGGKGSEMWASARYQPVLKRNDSLNLELCIRCGHASAETLSPDLHECLLCRICVSKSVFWFLFTAPSFRSSSSYFSPPSISLTTSLSLISY